MRKKLLLFLIIISLTPMVKADEGMWLLSLLKNHTIEEMQAEGFKLSAEDIYSVNQACLKDAVVIFGGGCTGEMISGQGLLLTNHHCGYGEIQSHSSVENDYLTDGFWAMSREEELPNPGLTVDFMRYMRDVTDDVLAGIPDDAREKDRDSILSVRIEEIIAGENLEESYRAIVRPMFYGNQYFLFVYQQFSDVRLVGAPPSSIGNFGEDNDNWMWPRHTGDFSIFRVYANEQNEPADYDENNVPYKPGKHFEISLKGVQEGDFTMLLGYPGSTRQFLYSDYLEYWHKTEMPLRVELRTLRLDVMDKYMKTSDRVRIQYASKFRGVSNAWKKWQGAIGGLDRLTATEKKREMEADFADWVAADVRRKELYGDILPAFDEIYGELNELEKVSAMIIESAFAVELMSRANRVLALMQRGVPAEVISESLAGFYKDFHMPIDREMFAVMMEYLYQHMDPDFQPAFFSEISKKYKLDFKAFADKVYDKTVFSSETEMNSVVGLYAEKPEKAIKKLKKDPIVIYMQQFRTTYIEKAGAQLGVLSNSLDSYYRRYVKALMEFQPEKRFYPDANFTMRLTFGKVDGYDPRDAVEYEYFTTLSGVMEKNRMGRPDYAIQEKLKTLYETKDYGQYGVDHTMPVCFTASNHTSGGNSGSPVLNAEGQLIGINFDRNWEGTMSDEMYDPDMCRNISVDIRYILFIIDKFAGAGYLVDEMSVVK